MIQQIHPTIPVVTPKGKGIAIAWIDYSSEDDLYWVVFQTDTCECWTWANKDIRAQQNLTIGRKKGELLPYCEPPPPAATKATMSAMRIAFESGFRRGEKGMNLSAALIEFDKLTKL
jgi:hypothetical protein